METTAVFFRGRPSERELRALLDRVAKPRIPMPPNEDTPALGGVTTFVGVSEDPGRSVQSAGTGLYELWTDTDVPIRLHDMSFEGLDYRYDLRPTLVLRFRYDDAEWTPAEAVATPVAEMTFDDVRIRRWEEEAEALADVDAPWGLVSMFDYDERSDFDLQTYSLRLTFSARRVRVRLTSGDSRPSAEE